MYILPQILNIETKNFIINQLIDKFKEILHKFFDNITGVWHLLLLLIWIQPFYNKAFFMSSFFYIFVVHCYTMWYNYLRK